MDRREMLLGSAAMLAMAATGQALAAEHQHEHHHADVNPIQGLIDATADCTKKGQVCLSHCLVLLGQGDKAMAACAQSVSQMLAVCGALQQLASAKSPLLAAQAKVAMDACKACEDECKKHANKHQECKICGEACVVCYKECKKIVA